MDNIQPDKKDSPKKRGRPKGSKNSKKHPEPKGKKLTDFAPPVRTGRLRGRPRKDRTQFVSDKSEENGGILTGAKRLLGTITGEKKQLPEWLEKINKEKIETAEALKEPFIKAMELHQGKPTYAAKELGLGYVTVRKWYRDDPEFRKRFDEIRAARVDFVEDALMQNIEQGKEISSIFFLKCQGRDRGWVERQEVNHSGAIIHAHGITADQGFIPRFVQLLAEAQGAGEIAQLPVVDSERPVLPNTVCDEQDGLRQRLAVPEVQGSPTESEWDDRPVGEGTQEVNDNHVCQDDSGHTGESRDNGRDIQPYEADCQELPETDQEGA